MAIDDGLSGAERDTDHLITRIYGFIANIYFYEIDTRLKQFVVAHGHIVRYCRAIHDAVMAKQT